LTGVFSIGKVSALNLNHRSNGEVAELVDALASGVQVNDYIVRVQVPLSAPFFYFMHHDNYQLRPILTLFSANKVISISYIGFFISGV